MHARKTAPEQRLSQRTRFGFHLGPSAVGAEEGGKTEKERVIFVMAIVFSNKATSSLVGRRRGYHAGARVAAAKRE